MAIIIKNGDNYNSHTIREYMLESTTESDILNELSNITDAAPGSYAATANLDYIYRLNNNNEWESVGV